MLAGILGASRVERSECMSLLWERTRERCFERIALPGERRGKAFHPDALRKLVQRRAIGGKVSVDEDEADAAEVAREPVDCRG
jgi:hypothetical protein